MLLRAGKSLSEATAELAAKFGIGERVLPMSNDRFATLLDTAQGTLNFQEYFVRERHQPEVKAVRFDGAIELVQKIPWRTNKELLKRI